MKKTIATLLTLVMMLSAVAGLALNASAADEIDPCYDSVYRNDFSANESLLNGVSVEDELFVTEYPFEPTNGQGNDSWAFATSPEVLENGGLKFEGFDGMTFNWTNLEGMTLDNSKTYTFRFSIDVTAKGNGTDIRGGGWKREVYFGFGGYYNQIEFNSNGRGIRAGDTWTDSANYELGKYDVVFVFAPAQNKTMTTITKGGVTIADGFRSGTQYNVTNANAAVWTWRCEGGSFTLSDLSVTDGSNTWNADFENEFVAVDNIWMVGNENEKNDANFPQIEDGVVKFDSKDAMSFHWKNYIGAFNYKNSVAYTFEFDLKVTNEGNGSNWANPSHTRVIYIAFGGYYDQVGIIQQDGKVRVGDSYPAYESAKYLNKVVHIALTLQGNNTSITISDSEGNVISTGGRSNSVYSSADNYMNSFVIRCEDGAAELDNFKFTAVDPDVDTPHSTEKVGVVNANCQHGGYTGDDVCTRCEQTIAIGSDTPVTTTHAVGDWYVSRPATVAKTGEERRDCADCDYYETKVIDRLPAPDGYIELKLELDTAINELHEAMINNTMETADVLTAALEKLNDIINVTRVMLEDADAQTKKDLESAIAVAQIAIDAAIEKAEDDLDEAASELIAALENGKAELSVEIAKLEAALEAAQAASKIADAENFADLAAKITKANETLSAAVDKKLADAKAELKADDADINNKIATLENELADANTLLIVFAVIAVVALLGDGAILTLVLVSGKKKSKKK